MLDIFSHSFIQRAFVAGFIVGILGGFYGSFIVQRRMSFLGDGLAHIAFGGVALGLLLQFEPLSIAIPFTITASILLTYLKEKTNLEIDTAIGILFAVSVALGVLFISLNKRYTSDAFSYLFGSILLVSKSDLIFAGLFTLLTFLLSYFYWKRWTYASFDSELALSDHIPVSLDNYILSILIALAVVISIKLVGIILVASFLIIPSATSKLISNSFGKFTLLGIFFGVIGAVFGIYFAILFDVPSGSGIILFQALIFLIILLFSKFIH
ncbi:MAG: metal ABC transporter permease [Candidatus Kapaibacteriales bacterium]